MSSQWFHHNVFNSWNISVRQKLGKGLLHAHKFTKMKNKCHAEKWLFYSVLHLSRWVGDTWNNFIYVALIDQLFSLTTPHSLTHSDVWLSTEWGALEQHDGQICPPPTKGRPEVTPQYQAWLNIDQQCNIAYMLLDLQKTPSTTLLFIPQGLQPHHVKTLSFSVVAWVKAVDYVRLCTFSQKM